MSAFARGQSARAGGNVSTQHLPARTSHAPLTWTPPQLPCAIRPSALFTPILHPLTHLLSFEYHFRLSRAHPMPFSAQMTSGSPSLLYRVGWWCL
jgi:hypothetical protein